ncbi:MAG: Mur ligase family protein [Clostridia bacterium]|nr:Mur ligase family protein [Clostridia bacterium]
MKRKLINFLKRVYARLLRFKIVWSNRKKINKLVRKIRKHNLASFEKKVMKQYESCDIEDTSFQSVNIEKDDNRVAIFGYDVVGSIDGIEKCDYVEYGTNLAAILDNEDIDIKIGYADDSIIDSEALKYLQNTMSLYAVSDNRSYLVTVGDFKVAVIGGSVEREKEITDGIILDENLVKNIVYARKQNVNHIIVYLRREAHKSTAFTPYERAYVRFIANMGVDSIFATNSEGIHIGGNTMRIDRSFSDTVASMGTLAGTHEDAPGSALAIRIKLVPGETKGEYITNKGYIPLYNDFETEEFKNVMRIDYHNSEHRRNKEMMRALEYIEDETYKLRDIRNILTIKDICDILNVELPEKYAYLGYASVGKVCARSFEVNSGDVLFFREPFMDPNDKDVKPLEIRLRIVDNALKRGARFIFSYVDLDESIPHVKVENAREGHIAVCARLRDFYEVKTVGITGSVGKTSTKDMLYNVLNEKYATYRNLRNSNTQVNIGMHIQNFRGGYEFFIQEIGGGRPGGASRHSRMIKPVATVITNIGHAHIGNYGTQEAIMESKLGIIDGMDEHGTLFLNGDDPLLVTAKPAAETVFFAVHNKNADYYAEDVREDNGKTYFTICHNDERIPAMLNVLGEYNVLNAVGCFAIGRKFGIEDSDIVEGISKFETSGVRQNLISVAGYNLFVDCFNASPASVDSSLSVLDKIEVEGDQKKIAVIGDITGAAELSSEIHKEVGEIVKTHTMDVLICYGEESKQVYDMAKEAGYNAYHFLEPSDLERFIKKTAKVGDVILFKGSSKMLLAERIDSMFGTMLADQRYIDGVKFKTAKQNRVTYNLYPDYATVVNAVDYDGKISIAKNVRGRVVYNLGDGAFSDKENITGVKLHRHIRHIGDACFHGCGMIKSIDLPDSVKYIGERAFAECNNLEKITVCTGMMHIAKEAFAECSALNEIYLPATITEMGEDVFANCDNLTAICERGSYAADYCEKNGVQYKFK